MPNTKLRLLAGTMLLMAPAATSLAAEAAGSAQNTVTEVIVTAQKRAENVQHVPASIVALSGEQLQKTGADSVKDLTRLVPSLEIYSIAQVSGVTLEIRGFGTSSNAAIDPDVAPYLDGIYIPRPGAILTSFLDINTVEVSRGPQGTLFGRNATVGALNITTKEPSFSGFNVEAGASVGNYDSYSAHGIINLPMGDKFAVRAAVEVNNEDGGLEKNLYNGQRYGKSDVTAGRLSAKWAPSSSIEWVGRFDMAQMTGDGLNVTQLDVSDIPATVLAAYKAKLTTFGATAGFGGPGFTTYVNNKRPSLNDRQYGVSSNLTWSLGSSGYQLRLIDSYRNWRDHQDDGELSQTTLDGYYRHAQFISGSQSHELQFISPKDKLLGGRLDYVAGLYYFEEDYSIATAIDLGSQYCQVFSASSMAALNNCNLGVKVNANQSVFNQTETSYAGFFQANFKILDPLIVTAGVRDTHDKKTGSFNDVASNPGTASLGATESENNLVASQTKPTWTAKLTWNITPSIMTYFSYSTGYKSGGFNSSGNAVAPLTAATRTFNPETSDNYELGVKSVVLDHRLLLNADIYQMDINQFQARSFNGLSFVIKNAGDIRARGVEVDGQFSATSHIKFDFGGDYLDSIYTSNATAGGLPGCNAAVANSCVGYETIVSGNPTIQNLTGRQAALAPKWQGNLGAQYDTSPFAGGYVLQIRPAITFEDSFYSTPDLSPNGYVNSHTLLDLRVNLVSPTKRWTLTLYGTNITNEKYFMQKNLTPNAAALKGTDPVTGAALMRGFMGAPAMFGARFNAKF